ncbi:MAG: LVIVD repeat-containing protein [Salinigranum sp.]
MVYELDRRTILKAFGSLKLSGALGLAGCSGPDEESPPGGLPPDGTPTAGNGTATAGNGTATAGRGTPTTKGSPASGYRPAWTPPVDEIPAGGVGVNFELVGHTPLPDDHQYRGDSLGMPRGSNGDITVAGDCVYVGSLIGYQPPLIVDVSDPTDPTVLGPVPDAVPGVGNGVEGIETSGDVLVVDQRRALGGLGFDVPAGMPERGLAIYDVSTPRKPELVGRYDYGGRETHTVTLWRDPSNPERLLAVQTFTDHPSLAVVDLTGCPGDCDPSVVAEWDLRSQLGIDRPTHEAVVSTDGTRIYAAQYGAGVLTLDSTNLLAALRGEKTSDPSPPQSTPGEGHCLTVDPDLRENLDAQPHLVGEWQHTVLKVPDRPYLLAATESGGVEMDAKTGTVQRGTCPGGRVRLFELGDEGRVVGPDPVGVYGVPEQAAGNCDGKEWAIGGVAKPAWLSPHDVLAFPDVAFATYYSAGLRAIDISDPTRPVEAGHFFNDPVDRIRWASYGVRGDRVTRDGRAVRQPPAAGPHMFAFSYPQFHDGHVVYADVHSGLYVLKYTGPHADRLPDEGNCQPASPGAVKPGYEPCPPYGRTNYE